MKEKRVLTEAHRWKYMLEVLDWRGTLPWTSCPDALGWLPFPVLAFETSYPLDEALCSLKQYSLRQFNKIQWHSRPQWKLCNSKSAMKYLWNEGYRWSYLRADSAKRNETRRKRNLPQRVNWGICHTLGVDADSRKWQSAHERGAENHATFTLLQIVRADFATEEIVTRLEEATFRAIYPLVASPARQLVGKVEIVPVFSWITLVSRTFYQSTSGTLTSGEVLSNETQAMVSDLIRLTRIYRTVFMKRLLGISRVHVSEY